MADEAKKKNQHVEKLGKIEDYLAPWETAAGEIDIDKPKLKRYVYGLALDAAKRADRAEEAEARIAEAEEEAKTAKAELASNDSSGKIAQLETENATLTTQRDTAVSEKLRLEVGIEKGLTPKQAARLQGSTLEELEKDADEVAELFGLKKGSEPDPDDDDDDEDDDDDAAGGLLQSPQRLNNPADSRDRVGASDQEIDIAKAVDGFRSNNF